MKAVQFSRFGPAEKVAELVDVPEPPAPGPGEVLIQLLASPVNPSEFLSFEGRFGSYAPKMPAFAGGEAVGRIVETGQGVTHLRRGDRVLTQYAGRGSWRERLTAKADGMFPLPSDIDTLQLAMLAVNPPTAWNMLHLADLQPGDHVLQNAGSSSVGYNVIRMAKHLGFRTINIVRQEHQAAALIEAGADAVVIDGPDLPASIRNVVGEARIPLAFDAVAGTATQALANAVSPGGTVVIYGILSGGTSDLDATDILFREVTLRGFWLTQWFRRTPHDEKQKLYERLAGLMRDGTIRIPVAAAYPLARFKDALGHAAQTGRHGKVLVTME